MYGKVNPFKIAIYAIVGLFVLSIILGFFTVTDAGTVKVVKRLGKTERVLQPGFEFKAPILESTVTLPTKKVIYETAPEEKQKGSNADYQDYPVDTNTSDGNSVDVSYTIRFSVDPAQAEQIVNRFGGIDQVVESTVKAYSRVDIRNTVRKYSAKELYQGDANQKVQDEMFQVLEPKFRQDGIILDSVGIREISFSPEYVQAIEAKERARIEVETAEQRAEAAEFDKQAEITRAEGQAEAQRLLRQDLTEDLVAKLWIEKWDGKMPLVAGEGNIIDISNLTK